MHSHFEGNKSRLPRIQFPQNTVYVKKNEVTKC